MKEKPKIHSLKITQDTTAGRLSTKIKSLQKDLKREIEVCINSFRRYEDKSRENPPVFNPGDMVWPYPKNIKSTRPTRKLCVILLCIFQILKKFRTHAYPLKLPSQWKSIDSIFHVSLLEPVKTSSIPNRYQEPPPLISIEEEEECEASQRLDSKLKKGKSWYLVQWKGFSQ
ncbi:hypothetical protein O181_066016 [Austropuccinia psidii MF-1]|uniref:Tf2-1-like SH3-like domain-containing protein n=1 Tax=Austropuccinia psidii MF-1 TaxID=1389203 RepID=A0A9Q3I1S6_9BASI|nr:hypothetical protein [Austropuccinia psidii MF-1]